MQTAAMVLTLISAVEHVYFFVLEAILWRKPLGLKTFKMDAAQAEATASLAQNQGTYNLFLAAGLAWSTFAAEPIASPIRYFFLGCVLVAAAVGGITVNMRILLVQG